MAREAIAGCLTAATASTPGTSSPERRPKPSRHSRFTATCRRSERSIRAAWFKHLDAELKPRPSYTTTAPSNWRQWSTANQWVQRASDHDGDLDRRARLRMAEDLIKARNRIKDIGVAALVKLAQRLASASSDEIEMRTWSNMFARASEMVLRATGGYLPQGDSDQDDEDLD